MNDQHMIRQLQSNNEKALQKCMNRYMKYVTYIVENVIGCSLPAEDKEEVVSDVFIQLWKNRSRLDSSYTSLKPYLAQIARNRAKNALRNLSSKEYLEFDETINVGNVPDTDQQLINEEIIHEITNMLREFSRQDQRIFLGYYYYQKPIRDIAKEVGLNDNTVKVRLHRCRVNLREKLKEKGFDYYE